jgi:hypothetical protein
MWVIRPEQIAALDADTRERFLRELAAHVRRHFAARLAVITDEELLERVRRTVDRAAAHGLTQRRSVSRFVDLSIVFGEQFDAEQEWAARLLADSAAMDQRVRAEWLYELGLRQLDGRGAGRQQSEEST